ncbi:MAG: HPP family protein [Desulfonatronovibrio sp.]
MDPQDNNILDKFKSDWQYYIFQSIAATLAIFFLLLLVSIQKKPVIVASIAATTFIVFAMPNYITAQPRNLVGGHIAGMLCGFLFSMIPFHLILPQTVALSFMYALAVGASFFIMVATDTEHPPAAGTALGVAMAGFSLKITLTILISVTFLACVHYFFRHQLRDLT